MRQEKDSDFSVTGNLNFEDTKKQRKSWKTPYGEKVPEKPTVMNMSHQVASQLEIVLCIPKDINLDRGTDNLLHNSSFRNNKYFSDQ